MKINHDITRKSPISKNIKRLTAQHNIVRYFCNRVAWHYYPRLSILKEYPLHLDIELSNYCQLKCPMCFRFHRPLEKQGNMEIDLFRNIIDEIAGKVYSIKFTGRGEPLMNRDFCKFMEYVRNKGIQEAAIITNGQLMKKEIMSCMIEEGMDRVAFSIDGLKEEYEQIRAPIKYEEIMQTVTQLYEMRSRKNSVRPLIRIQAVKTSVKKEKEFLKIWQPISDEVLFLKYKDYSRQGKEKKQASYRCPFLHQRMIIHWDGTVPMCINDEYEESVMGNARQSRIREIWKGYEFEKARSVDKENMRAAVYKNCSRCQLHQ